MVPMSDDERRDLETHLKEHFRLSLAMQVKAAHVLYQHGRISRLQKRFSVKRERLIDDLFFWYFFGFMDLATAACVLIGFPRAGSRCPRSRSSSARPRSTGRAGTTSC